MSNYRKIRTIIAHEFLTKVKNKWFLIATIIGPILMVAIFAVPALITYFTMQSTTQKMPIIDLTNKFGSEIVKQNKEVFYLSNLNIEALSDSVRLDKISSFLVIDTNMLANSQVKLYSMGSGGLSANDKILKAVNEVRTKELLATSGIDTNTFANISKSIEIKELKLSADKNKGIEENNSDFQFVLAYIIAFAIYMMIILYGSKVMNGVIEEKANRIVEIIVSSAKPFEIMFGKVVGIGLVGIVQVLFWVILVFIILYIAAPLLQSIGADSSVATQMPGMGGTDAISKEAIETMKIPSISPLIVFSLFFYFLAGYFIYATLYAGIGSAVDQESDAGQISTPITILIVVPILMISAIVNDPNSTMSIILSLVPFFSPILMLARIIITDGVLPMWQVILSMILCILTFLGCLWIAAKIYRIGILSYGKKPTFSDLWKWVRQAQ